MNEITYNDIKNNDEINEYLEYSNECLRVLGFTEHGRRHGMLVANRARNILKKLGYSKREAELAAIAGYLHDIGNMINRNDHSQIGALFTLNLLKNMDMPRREITTIISAIGNHDEEFGHPVNNVAAALILADKSDVHRSRVRNDDFATFDIHDRVNYAAQHSCLNIFPKEGIISLNINIDIEICPVIEYFEIFLSRMILCRRAANFLNCHFELIINNAKLL
ncbi:MAG TPA: HD domain-containing protein [Clostridiales bacterium]|jgi:metal-dependent HD superfamily phosphatase/phosphodiesterase|nr:HD domain-containing protein [Clostridiales bacterium]